MKQKKSLLLLFTTAVLSCYAPQLRAESLTPQIGVILPLTGPSAPFGELVRSGLTNTDTAVKLVFEDDACNPQNSVTAYNRLKQKGITLFLGPCCTSGMAAVAPLIARDKAVSINACIGSEKAWALSEGRVFHTQYSAQAEGRFNAKVAWERGAKKVALIYMENEFSLAQKDGFTEAFPGEVVANLSYTNNDLVELKSILLKLRGLSYDAVYIPIVEPFLIGILSESVKMGIDLKQVYSIFSFQMQDVLTREGENAEGVIYSYPDIPGDQPAAAYFSGSAAKLLSASAQTCDAEPDCVKQELLKHGQFNEAGNLSGKIILKTVKNGKFVTLE